MVDKSYNKFMCLDRHVLSMFKTQISMMLEMHRNVTSFFCYFDYQEFKNLPAITIVIPVTGRVNHLKQSVTCLKNQVIKNGLESKVNIIVSEMGMQNEHESFCDKIGVSYVFTQAGMFSKSMAMNQAARMQPSESFIFYDVDLVTEDRWLLKCLERLESQKKKGSTCWIAQPIPQRKLYYVNGEISGKIFTGQNKLSDFEKSQHMVQPSWYEGKFPPGGAIHVSANLLYAVQGFDYNLYWGHSPEDVAFLENCLELSDDGELLLWGEEEGCDMYHLYHPDRTGTNISSQYMHAAKNIIEHNGLRYVCLHDKLLGGLFQSWIQINPTRYRDTLSTRAMKAYKTKESLDEFHSKLDEMLEKESDLQNQNPALYKLYDGFVEYVKSNPEYFENFNS